MERSSGSEMDFFQEALSQLSKKEVHRPQNSGVKSGSVSNSPPSGIPSPNSSAAKPPEDSEDLDALIDSIAMDNGDTPLDIDFTDVFSEPEPKNNGGVVDILGEAMKQAGLDADFLESSSRAPIQPTIISTSSLTSLPAGTKVIKVARQTTAGGAIRLTAVNSAQNLTASQLIGQQRPAPNIILNRGQLNMPVVPGSRKINILRKAGSVTNVTPHMVASHGSTLNPNVMTNRQNLQRVLANPNVTTKSSFNVASTPRPPERKQTLTIRPIHNTALQTTSGNVPISKAATSMSIRSTAPAVYAGIKAPVMIHSASTPALLPTHNGGFVSMNNNDMISYISPEKRRAMFGEEEEEDAEDLGQAETYAEYEPKKLKLGSKHPDPVVESSTLSSVEPPDIHYKLELPDDIIQCGMLSSLQLEAVVYASQRHNDILPNKQRAGFLIGDGAGVGKGRTIAGIIFENYLQGRKKAIWLSVSNDLKPDAERDLRDVGADEIRVHSLTKFKYAKIAGRVNGRVKEGVIFATYSSLIGESQGSANAKYKTRLKQLLHWCGKKFKGVIVFDECHKAKNLLPSGSQKATKTGITVLALQEQLPNARVVYASATGATEPRNMAYMTRLGLWGEGTAFNEFSDFIQTVEQRGVGAMEMIAMDMKLRGMYTARQLSFKDVKFRVSEVALENVLIHEQYPFVEVYDECVALWTEVLQRFSEAARLLGVDLKFFSRTILGPYWASHQRFFKYLTMSGKLQECVKLANEAVKNGKCVIIGLQSTGEARTLEIVEHNDDLNDFVSTTKGVIQSLVEKHFPTPETLASVQERRAGKAAEAASKAEAGANRPKSLRDIFGEAELDDILSGKGVSNRASGCVRRGDPGDKGCSKAKRGRFDDGASSYGGSMRDNSSDYMDSDLESNPEKRVRRKKIKKKKKKESKKRKRGSSDDSSSDSVDSDFDPDAVDVGAFMNKFNRHDDLEVDEDDACTETLAPMVDWNAPLDTNFDPNEVGPKVREMKAALLRKIDRVGKKLPPNALDELIDKLGGPEAVAEMTGRKGRVVIDDDGGVSYEHRREADVTQEEINLAEKQRFMDGEKLIAIISEAASSGISLQADRRVRNQKRRLHITLELPWSADRAIQQFGRSHRSNQVSSPEYVFLITNLAGEQRFASSVARRLESLGALTHGDRRATESRDLSRFNLEHEVGREALNWVLWCVVGREEPLVDPPTYPGGCDKFFADVRNGLQSVGLYSPDSGLERESNNMPKFLNRILGMTVMVQNALFRFFSDTLEELTRRAKRDGRLDLGIMDLGVGGQNLEIIETRNFDMWFLSDRTHVHLHKVLTRRGLSWEEAHRIHDKAYGNEDGFYLSKTQRGNKPIPLLAVRLESGSRRRKEENLYRIYKPNTGMQMKPMEYAKLREKFTKFSIPGDCKGVWDRVYHVTESKCVHVYYHNRCQRPNCEMGKQTHTYYVLSGSVLNVWSRVEEVLKSRRRGAHYMQIVRLKTEDGRKIVGSLIPADCVPNVSQILQTREISSVETSISRDYPSMEMPSKGLFSSGQLDNQILQNFQRPSSQQIKQVQQNPRRPPIIKVQQRHQLSSIQSHQPRSPLEDFDIDDWPEFNFD